MKNSTTVCEHGVLERQCLTCEQIKEINRLNTEVKRLKSIIYRAAMASETVDHYDGTRELRSEAMDTKEKK